MNQTRSFDLSMTLGEGPTWNPSRGELTVVDILGRLIHGLAYQNGAWELIRTIPTESDTGAAIPIEGGDLVSVETEGIFFVSGDRRERICAIPELSKPSQRPNDAKLGPDGRLYVGVMDYTATSGAGKLWAIKRSGESELLLDNLTIPNGMDWWEDIFWFVNGPEPRVTAYRPGPRGLEPCGEILTNGVPDGMTIDSAGNIWVALWGDGRVDCYQQDGVLVSQIRVPASLTTSVAFCGPRMKTLAITTARYQMSEDELQEFPLSGSVFFAEADVAGRPANLRWAN